MIPDTFGIVPLHILDQGLVNRLCRIIYVMAHELDEELSDNDKELLERIITS